MSSNYKNLHYICGDKQKKLIYFDCNATTPTLDSAINAAIHAMKHTFGNPSSVHTSGLQAKQILQKGRERASTLLNTLPESIIFTSGATESIQTAVFSALCAAASRKKADQLQRSKLLYTVTEHKAVSQSLAHWNSVLNLNLELVPIQVKPNGLIDIDHLKEHIEEAWFIATMAVNNETGVIQDLKEIEKIIRSHNPNALWLVDCVQGLGKIELDFDKLSIDYASFSGHKIYAPKGIGFLYSRKEAPFVPLIVGGGQERGFRSGTENLPGVAAFSEVLRLLNQKNENTFKSKETLEKYRAHIINALKDAFPTIVFNAPTEITVPTCLNFSVKGFASHEILNVLDAGGVRVSAGSACSASKMSRSFVLDAMGLPEWQSAGAIRLSFGPTTTEEEITQGCTAIMRASKILKGCGMVCGPQIEYQRIEDIQGVTQFVDGHRVSWVIASSIHQRCIVIDPSIGTFERIAYFIKASGLTISEVVATSPCFQQEVKGFTDTAKKENISKAQPKEYLQTLYDEQGKEYSASFIGNCGILNAQLCLIKIATPGAYKESVSYILIKLSENSNTFTQDDILFLFSGDTLFIDGIGLTKNYPDAPYDLFNSLHLINKIVSEKTLVCSSYLSTRVPSLTWKALKQWNGMLGLTLSTTNQELYRSLKEVADKESYDEFPRVCGKNLGVRKEYPIGDDTLLLSVDEINKKLDKNPTSFVFVDVRETYEYVFSSENEILNIPESTKNVPLSRFVNLMCECLHNPQMASKEVVFICRSGDRALRAALSMKLAGVSNICCLKGGIACGCSEA